MPLSSSYFYPQVHVPNSSYPSLDLREVSSSLVRAATNMGRLYVFNDNSLHYVNEAGSDIELVSATGGSVISGNLVVSGSIEVLGQIFDGDSDLILSSAIGSVIAASGVLEFPLEAGANSAYIIATNSHLIFSSSAGSVVALSASLKFLDGTTQTTAATGGTVTGSGDFFVTNEMVVSGSVVSPGHLILSSTAGSVVHISSSLEVDGDLAFQQARTISTTAGNLTLNPNSNVVVGTPSGLHIGSSANASLTDRMLQISHDFGEANGTTYGAVITSTQHETTSATASVFNGVFYRIGIGSSNSQNYTQTVGMRTMNLDFFTNSSSTGVITGATTMYVKNATQLGATFTNTYGIYMEGLTKGTNNYGIYINTPTGTIADAIHVVGGRTFLGGDLVVNGNITISASDAGTSVGTAGVVVDTFATTDFRTVKYVVSVSSGSSYQSEEILLLHSASTVVISEYAVLSLPGANFIGFEASITGSVVNLLASGSAPENTVKLIRTTITV